MTQRLGFRLSSLFAVALLPLGLISLIQADEWLASARRQASAALEGDTLRAAGREARLIHEAQGAAAALAQTVASLLPDEAACDAALSGVKAAATQYSLVAYVPPDGLIACASDGVEVDASASPIFQRVAAAGRPMIVVNPQGTVSGTAIVAVTHPLPEPAGSDSDGAGSGSPGGWVSLSLPHAALVASRPVAQPLAPGGPDGAAEREAAPGTGPEPDLVTFNAAGEVLTSSLGLDGAGAVLPRDRALAALAAEGGVVFAAEAASGGERFFAVVPLIEGELFALGSVPARRAVTVGGVSVAAPFLVAATMWAGSLLIAWYAAERLVTRYIRRLSGAISSFAQGSRLVGDLDMARAPAEIREAGDAFGRMTDAILHDEAELEDTVHQREVLLREVHHRVKNNLQLIASIMNMQMRRARSPETRTLMQGLQDRVMSLATVHKELYQTTGVADVRADELLGDIVRQIVGLASTPGRRFQIESDFAPLRLTPDQAVPLALLLTEGLTNAIRHTAGPGTGPGAMETLRLRLAFAPIEAGRAALSIANSARGAPPGIAASAPAAAGEPAGLGGQLIAAFAAQLGGAAREEAVDGRHALVVEFPLAPLEGGEERRVAPPMALAV